MDPITLHFKVFQVGGAADTREDLKVDNPGGTTVASVKQKVFADALEEQKTVRFISSGKLLNDLQMLDQCGLGKEAFIHVMISEPSARMITPDTASGSATGVGSTLGAQCAAATDAAGGKGVLLSGISFFVVTAAMLQLGWQRRALISASTSQLLFIGAAVWAYCALCHGLPVVVQMLSVFLAGENLSATNTTNSAHLQNSTTEASVGQPSGDAGALRERQRNA